VLLNHFFKLRAEHIHAPIGVNIATPWPIPCHTEASLVERAEDILGWAASYADGPGLPEEATHRDSIYE
jgi:hypothetical protein